VFCRPAARFLRVAGAPGKVWRRFALSPMLDIEQPDQLLAWLRETGRVGAAERPGFQTLAGGVSNRAVLVRRENGEAWVLKQALDRLRVAVEWFSSPERAHREALGMRWLAELAPEGAIPRLLFEDHEHHVIAMTAVPEPHENWKTLLLEEGPRAEHVSQSGRILGGIHRAAAARSAELEAAFADRSYFEALRLEPFYEFAAAHAPRAASFLPALVAETRALRQTLVHGDYSPKNILVRQGRMILLDHEVIHWGDPAFDVGFATAHLLSKGHARPSRRAAFGEAASAFWNAYAEAAGPRFNGIAARERAIRHALGCLLARVAGRSQVEYLDPAGRLRQRDAVLELMAAPPRDFGALANRFFLILERAEAVPPCQSSPTSTPLKSSTAAAGPPSKSNAVSTAA
jgi:5-methylthioribose kinase